MYRPTSSRAGEDPSSRARLSWSRLCLAGPRTKGEFADFSSESPPIESGTFKGTSLSLDGSVGVGVVVSFVEESRA